MDSIIVALITGGCTLIGVVISNLTANAKIAAQLEKAQAVTDNNLSNIKENMKSLTEEVRKHNAFGDRITALETRIAEVQERIERIDTRITRLHES